MKFEISKQTMKTIGDGAWRLTKHVLIKGVQATVTETAGGVTLSLLQGNKELAKEQLTFDAIVGPKKIKTDKPKKKWFGKNKEVEELAEEVTEAAVIEKLEEAKAIIEADGK
jgi:hypothetical protein